MVFTYQFGDSDDVTFHMYTSSAVTARWIQDRIQTVCGSRVERDGNFLYVCVYADDVEDAIQELRSDGFDCEEG